MIALCRIPAKLLPRWTGTLNRTILARTLPTSDLERLTTAFGQELFARIDRRGPMILSRAWWDDRLMGLTMGDEAVKVQLFRFIDALPLLDSPQTITRHLREYFEEAKAHLPGWARFGLRYMPQDGWAGRFLAHSARSN